MSAQPVTGTGREPDLSNLSLSRKEDFLLFAETPRHDCSLAKSPSPSRFSAIRGSNRPGSSCASWSRPYAKTSGKPGQPASTAGDAASALPSGGAYLAALGPTLRPSDQLLHRLSLPVFPTSGRAQINRRARKVPASLWPSWDVRLSPPNPPITAPWQAPHQQNHQPQQKAQLTPATGAEIHADHWGEKLYETHSSRCAWLTEVFRPRCPSPRCRSRDGHGECRVVA